MSKPLHFDALSVSSVSDLGSGLTTPDTASIQAFTTPLDEVKHPSLKGAEQTPPLSDMEAGEPVEHNEFYMRDEMVVFQVSEYDVFLDSYAYGPTRLAKCYTVFLPMHSPVSLGTSRTSSMLVRTSKIPSPYLSSCMTTIIRMKTLSAF